VTKRIPSQHNNRHSPQRRQALKCLAWAGTGLVWTLTGGIPKSVTLSQAAEALDDRSRTSRGFQFVQISDTHIGFEKAANPDVVGTLNDAITRINEMPERPAFVLHTGDITHLSKASEFDQAQHILKGIRTSDIHYVPGEHDVLDETGTAFFERYGGPSQGKGWYSFDQAGVHFIALVNVVDLQPGGLGRLGPEQLKWLKDNLCGRSPSQPIVVFAHMPLWAAYEAWGWGTEDAVQALGYLRRFGSVTVLNGHIHQIMQKVEGNVTFHSARSTAYPQPQAGQGPGPGPLLVPKEQLRSALGLTTVSQVSTRHPLAIVDQTLTQS
jgi:3',5'-cyclic-AMP phosphodiesterase